MTTSIAVRVFRAGELPAETGVLVPADAISQSMMRERGMRLGGEYEATFKADRDLHNWRTMHAIANVVKHNIEDFENMKSHAIIKRLQGECGVGCDEFEIITSDGEESMLRVPRTLEFASMDETEFVEIRNAICQHIVNRYWPDCDIAYVLRAADENMWVVA